MRTLEWGKFSAQHSDFTLRDIEGSSVVVDAASANNVTGYTGGSYLRIGTTSYLNQLQKALVKVALTNLRAQLGYAPVLFYVGFHLWQADKSSSYASTTFSLYRLVASGIDYSDATYRYKDATGSVTWTNDAYGVVHDADALEDPAASCVVPSRTVPATGYSDVWDLTDEFRERLRNGQDLALLMRWDPLHTYPSTWASWYWYDATKYPYLEIMYCLPIEFFGAKTDNSIDLANPLDSALDVALYLGAYELGETGQATKAFIRNFSGRTLPHVEILDDHPEWTVPVQTVGTTGTFTHVQLDESAESQAYEIEFTSSTAYKVKATAYRDNSENLNPVAGGTGWTGSVSGDFAAPDGGLHIPAAAWDGSHSTGDKWTFYVIGNTTDTTWPSDSNDQVQMADDDGTGNAPDAATWRAIKARRILSAASVTIDATSKKIPTRAIVASQWTIGSPAFVADATNIHEGAVASVDEEDIAAVVFTGSGLNDCTSSGHYRGTTDESYEVEIDSTGTPDTFKWRKGSGSWTTGVAITGSAQAIGTEGVYVTFAATTGHTSTDTWAIACTAYGVTLSGLIADSTVYAAGSKVATSLPVRTVSSGVYALSTGDAGSGETSENYIPLTDADDYFSAGGGETVYIQDISDPDTAEEAVTTAVTSAGITLTADLTGHYDSGSPVFLKGSGEHGFWLRPVIDAGTTQEYKRVRLNVRV